MPQPGSFRSDSKVWYMQTACTNVPKFQSKIHKSTKQFGFSFAFDAPTV